MAKTRVIVRPKAVVKRRLRKQTWEVDVLLPTGKLHTYELTCYEGQFFDLFPELGRIDGDKLFDLYDENSVVDFDRRLISER